MTLKTQRSSQKQQHRQHPQTASTNQTLYTAHIRVQACVLTTLLFNDSASYVLIYTVLTSFVSTEPVHKNERTTRPAAHPRAFERKPGRWPPMEERRNAEQWHASSSPRACTVRTTSIQDLRNETKKHTRTTIDSNRVQVVMPLTVLISHPLSLSSKGWFGLPPSPWLCHCSSCAKT